MIDSHHSFWKHSTDIKLTSGATHPLQQDFLVSELEEDLDYSGVDQVVSIQTRRSDEENKFLIQQAQQSDDLVTGIVGWAPLASKTLRIFLDQYIEEPLIKGFREVFKAPSQEKYLNDLDFDQGVREITHRGLTFDLAISADQLPAIIALVDKHPNQSFVINHCGNPPINRHTLPKCWARNMRELARRPHVYCKLSGLSSDEELLSSDIRPYFHTLLHAFTPERLMFASDWPYCKSHTSYPAWLNRVDDLIDPLSHDEKAAIRQETAIRFYQL